MQRFHISVVFYRNMPQTLEFLPRQPKHVLNNFSDARLTSQRRGNVSFGCLVMSSKNNGHFTAKKN